MQRAHCKGAALPCMQVWDLAPYAKEGAAGSAVAPPAKLRALAATAAHDKDVNALAVSPNDALVASASQDRTAKARLC